MITTFTTGWFPATLSPTKTCGVLFYLFQVCTWTRFQVPAVFCTVCLCMRAVLRNTTWLRQPAVWTDADGINAKLECLLPARMWVQRLHILPTQSV